MTNIMRELTGRPLICDVPYLASRLWTYTYEDQSFNNNILAHDRRVRPRVYSFSLESDLTKRLGSTVCNMTRRIAGSNYRDMIESVDYDSVSGRCVMFQLDENRRSKLGFGQVKVKGVCFNDDDVLSPFTGLSPDMLALPLQIRFDKYGKILKQEFMPNKPTGAMELERAQHEFAMLSIAFRAGLNVPFPIGAGMFGEDTKYEGQRLGFIVEGLTGEEKDFRSAFAILLGGYSARNGSFQINLDPSIMDGNRQLITELFGNAGRLYRSAHEAGIFNHMSHPGNILVDGQTDVKLSDLEFSLYIQTMSPIQQVQYRLNEMMQFFFSFRYTI